MNVPALAQNKAAQTCVLTRWQDARSPCRARTLLHFSFLFSGYGGGANGTAAKEDARLSPLSTAT